MNGSEVEAEFVSQNKMMVTLKKAGGKTVSVPISKLSDDDQQYLADLRIPQNQYYAMKVVMDTSHKKISFKISPPWDSHVHVIEKICESNVEAREQGKPPYAIISDWGIEQTGYHMDSRTDGNSHEYKSLPRIRVEYILYLSTQLEADFTIVFEDLVPFVEVYGYNPETRKSKKIQFFNANEVSECLVDMKKIKSRCYLVEYTPDQ